MENICQDHFSSSIAKLDCELEWLSNKFVKALWFIEISLLLKGNKVETGKK